MTAREEFEAYKADYEKKLVKRARMQAIVLGSATVITILAMLYGLIKSIEASAQKDLAAWNEQKAVAAKLEADKQRGDSYEQIESLELRLDECRERNVKDAQLTCGKALATAEAEVQVAEALAQENLERAVKAEEYAKRSQQLSQEYQKKAEQISIDLKKQLDKCKSGR